MGSDSDDETEDKDNEATKQGSRDQYARGGRGTGWEQGRGEPDPLNPHSDVAKAHDYRRAGGLYTATRLQHTPTSCLCSLTSRSSTGSRCCCPERPMGTTEGASILEERYNIRDGSITKIQATVDQGNSIHTGVGISERCSRDISIGYAHRIWGQVNTASAESKLMRLGVTKGFLLKLDVFTTEFGCQAAIV